MPLLAFRCQAARVLLSYSFRFIKTKRNQKKITPHLIRSLETSGTQCRIFNFAGNDILHAFGDLDADRTVQANQASEIWTSRPSFT